MTKAHELTETLAQLDDVYHAIRVYAVRHQLIEHDFEGYQLLAQIRQILTQSKGIVEGFERAVVKGRPQAQKRKAATRCNG